MKTLALLLLLSAFSVDCKSQATKWMYLSQSNDGTIYYANILRENNKELPTFAGHNNVVLALIKSEKKKVQTDSFLETVLIETAIDTTNKQIATLSYVVYRDNEAVESHTVPTIQWEDVTGHSIAETYVKFARSLNNVAIRKELRFIEFVYASFPPKKEGN